MNMVVSLICWNCGDSCDEVPTPVSRHANCPSCFEMLHCCRMCLHYLPNERHNCSDDRTDPPTVKEVANFCEYFEPGNQFVLKNCAQAEKIKSTLDDLFDIDVNHPVSNSEGIERTMADPVNKLNDLFDD